MRRDQRFESVRRLFISDYFAGALIGQPIAYILNMPPGTSVHLCEKEGLLASDLAHSVDARFPRPERKLLNVLFGVFWVVCKDELGALPTVGVRDVDGGGLS